MNTTQLQANCSSSDSDISGLGVRLSFYSQSFLLVILVDRSWEEALTALWTFIATNFGLTIAAFTNSNLTLLEALQVSNLVWLANFGVFVALASYSRHKKDSRRRGKDRDKHRTSEERKEKHERNRDSDYWVKTAAMAQTLLSMAWTLYMWANLEAFGQCVSIVHYVLFVFPISLHRTGRIVGLTFTTILTCAYIATTVHEHYISYQKRKLKLTKKTEDSSVLPIHSKLSPLPPVPSPLPSANPSQETYQLTTLAPQISSRSHDQRSNRPDRKRWSDIDPMFIGILIFETIVFLYLIVSNEILLRDNLLPSQSFGFGQCLALVVVIPVLISVIRAFQEFGLRPRHAKTGVNKRGGRRRRRKQLSHEHMVYAV